MTQFRLDECVYCGRPAEHNEHVRPRSRGGHLTAPACRPCNLSKGARTPEEWFVATALKDELTGEALGRFEAMFKRADMLVASGILDPIELLRLADVRRTAAEDVIRGCEIIGQFALEVAMEESA